jgi:diguanylate cyclase (GGDEF)-like protein
MNDQRSDSGLPSILKKLGAMTAIRDTFMVEQSLLRTLGPLLGILETSFYRVDDNANILRAVHHSRKVVEERGSKRIVDNIEEVTNVQHVSTELNNLFESVRLLDKSCSRKIGFELLTCYPIYGDHQLLGYFVFQRDRETTPVEDAIIHGVLEVFTNYFALLDSSQRDQLTGLFNRYSLESNLDRLWSMLSANKQSSDQEPDLAINDPGSYWLCILDVDHFKKINDSYGHMIGDEVLIMVTRLLQSALRKSDLLYRFGGEEFVAIIAANDLESATEVFERCRTRIEEFDFPQLGHVTISGGFSSADPLVLPQEIMHRADSALYAAKDAGRNRIFHYGTLVEQGILQEIETGSIDLF